MTYADLQRMREYLRITDPSDTVDDAEMTLALQTATAAIDHICSRTFTVAPVDPAPATTAYIQPVQDRRSGQWILPIPDLQTADDLAVDLWDGSAWNTAVDTAGIGFMPFQAGTPWPWTELVLDGAVGYDHDPLVPSSSYIAVTARFGWEETPAAVQNACLIQAARIFKRRDSPFGMVNTLDGSEQARLTKTLDPDVVVALRPFIKYWAAR